MSSFNINQNATSKHFKKSMTTIMDELEAPSMIAALEVRMVAGYWRA